jgi:isoleucyl-tRNA synthetase
MRKDAGFEVTDRIRINFSADYTLFNAINQFNDYIANETLAESVESIVSEKSFFQEWTINEFYCKISIEKLIS